MKIAVRLFCSVLLTALVSGCSVFQPSVEQRLQRIHMTTEQASTEFSPQSIQQQLNELQQLRQEYPKDARIWLQSGRLSLKAGDCYGATVAFKQALGLEAEDADIFLGLGICADYADNHDDAQNYYRQGISRYPDSWPLQNNLAYSRLLQGNVQQALKDLKYLADVYPFPAVKHNLAIAFAMKGEFDQAYKIDFELYGEQQALKNQSAYRHLHQSGPEL